MEKQEKPTLTVNGEKISYVPYDLQGEDATRERLMNNLSVKFEGKALTPQLRQEILAYTQEFMCSLREERITEHNYEVKVSSENNELIVNISKED